MEKAADVQPQTQAVPPHAGKTLAMLEKLGFAKAAGTLKDLAERKRKLALAYEHYRFVRQEKIDAFNAKLKAKTMKGKAPFNATWQTLDFTPIANYEHTPPMDVLQALETAQERKCFDSYEVAYIRNVKDPILFGRIDRCPDRFYIAQWDDDVKIEDILQAHEG